MTDDVFEPGSHLLEINSKSGLYPLYLAYNLYRRAVKDEMFSPQTLEDHLRIWDRVVAESVFVICKTPMAKAITRRTLLGFRKGTLNMWAPEDLINKIKNQPELFIKKVHDLVGKNVKIKAIVGNPPYQESVGIEKANFALLVFDKFVSISKDLRPQYISMLIPSRWFNSGRGIDYFRKEMLNDKRMQYIHDFVYSTDVFPTVDIAGGVCYFLWNENHNGKCLFECTTSKGTTEMLRDLAENGDIFIRNNKSLSIISKIITGSKFFVSKQVSTQTPFGFITSFKGSIEKFENSVKLLGSYDSITYVPKEDIKVGGDWIDKYKVIFSKASAEHAGTPDKNGQYKILCGLRILEPNVICTQTYIVGGVYDSFSEAQNFSKYLSTRFVRFLMSNLMSTQQVGADKFRFVPLQDFTENSDIDWSQSVADIDRQLYKKYNLTDEEITFIESMIKPM